MSLDKIVHQEIILTIGHEWLLVTFDDPVTPPRGVVVFSHGLTGDHTGPQGLLRTLALDLVVAGYSCVRFDYRGSGDSSGEFAATTFEAMQSDLKTVLEYSRQRYPACPFHLLGLSIGGVIPALVAPQVPECQSVILLSSDLVEDVQFPVSGTVAIRGNQFFLPEKFFRERENLYPRHSLQTSGCSAILFYGSRDRKIARVAPEFAELGVNVKVMEGVDHLFETVTSRQLLSADLIEFLETQPSCSETKTRTTNQPG